MLNALLRFEHRLTSVVTGLALALLALASCLGFYQVLARFVFENPSDWTEVATRTSLIWMVYFGMVATFREGALVSVDVLYRLCTGRARVVLEGLITLVTLVFLVVVAWAGFEVTWRIRFQNLAGMGISISWAYLAVPLGACFSMLAVIAHFFDPQRSELESAQ
ncbi:MAG TPA: TRAP transporter small permease [Burkholderiaceae bacterium]|nr:TRAP transporter small permease [Burkholderiaceae bacterium]